MQEAAGAGQRFGQGRGTQAAATQEFETADTHRLGEEIEGFVVQLPVKPVVERCIAIDGNSAGRVCNINIQRRKKGRRVDPAAGHAGQHAGNKSHCDSGLRSGW
ncbi:hypothetical protein SDC9_188133 [bioreactor metagenome]|uniref:Uncharacterized protein n=1 Tax=bioreactor metagenome TaxID=1076179 RepID=A0A645HNG4_9ZZZZ